VDVVDDLAALLLDLLLAFVLRELAVALPHNVFEDRLRCEVAERSRQIGRLGTLALGVVAHKDLVAEHHVAKAELAVAELLHCARLAQHLKRQPAALEPNNLIFRHQHAALPLPFFFSNPKKSFAALSPFFTGQDDS
jgi:hypothetical protein